MWAEPLNPGDTIGIISPSHTVTPDDYAKIISGIEAKGFRVKTGSRLYRHTYGYAASETERADDLNEMVSDKDVKLVLFGGGYGSIELLPYIDYEAIRRNPKLFSSHSDGTSILNAIYTKTAWSRITVCRPGYSRISTPTPMNNFPPIWFAGMPFISSATAPGIP